MPFILAVDFDGTLFDGNFPKSGEPNWVIIKQVKEFKKYGAEIVLWTCRDGEVLQEAIDKCKEVGLVFDAHNDNTASQKIYIEKQGDGKSFSKRKIFANFYLDDRAHNLDFFLTIDAKKTCEKFKNY